ncbi:MAG: DUF3341 domain-containing protein, partial [Chloroflexi bacterium]|nr:DUF3341 domain-containing protein [Chloroflexota bacterium]
IVAAGAIATTLGGAAAGAIAGGLIGALVGAGIPEDDAKEYEDSVRQGSILLTVSATGAKQAGEAREIFDRHGGGKVATYQVGEGSGGAAASPRHGSSDTTTTSGELRD